MSPRIGACLALLLVALQAGTAVSAPATEPSDRACLLSWNAPSNHQNRVTLIATRPVTGLSLRGGRSFSYSWTKGAVTKRTAMEACLLTVAKPGRIQVVTGRWRFGPISRWSWGPMVPTTRPFIANVKLLSDGRLTKIYGR